MGADDYLFANAQCKEGYKFNGVQKKPLSLDKDPNQLAERCKKIIPRNVKLYEGIIYTLFHGVPPVPRPNFHARCDQDRSKYSSEFI